MTEEDKPLRRSKRGHYSEYNISRTKVATHLGMTQPTFVKLIGQGILPEDAKTLDEYRLAYIDFLRKEIEALRKRARPIDEGQVEVRKAQLSVSDEKAKNLKADTRLKHLKEATLKRELAPVVILEQILVSAAVRAKPILEAIGPTIKTRLPILSAAEINIINKEAARALEALADMQKELFKIVDKGDK